MNLPVYLDNNATTPLDPLVLEEMLPALREHFGNPASSTYRQGWFAEELVNIAREKVASVINATPEEIIFTSGATESNNLVIKGANAKHIVSVVTEHKAILDPLATLLVPTTLLKVNSDGLITPEQLQDALTPETTLVSIMLANNEIGVIHPIKELTKIVKSYNSEILIHTDATQALGKIPLDVNELGIDLLSLSSHKAYGPKGIGALYIKKKPSRIKLTPLLHGGGHEEGYRSGTLNVPAIIGFGKACEIITNNLASDVERITKLTEQILTQLEHEIEGISLNGSKVHRIPGNINLLIPGVSNAELVGAVNSKVAFSISSACTSRSKKPSHVLESLDLSDEEQYQSIRLGIGRFTTEEEIEFATNSLVSAIRKLCLKN